MNDYYHNIFKQDRYNRWGSGWRKLVEWDTANRRYVFRNHHILPLSWDERARQPIEMQNQYYWEEIERIERWCTAPQTKGAPASEGFDLFFNFLEG